MLAYDCHECGNPVPACEARMRSQAFAQVAFHAACLVAHTTRPLSPKSLLGSTTSLNRQTAKAARHKTARGHDRQPGCTGLVTARAT